MEVLSGENVQPMGMPCKDRVHTGHERIGGRNEDLRTGLEKSHRNAAGQMAGNRTVRQRY